MRSDLKVKLGAPNAETQFGRGYDDVLFANSFPKNWDAYSAAEGLVCFSFLPVTYPQYPSAVTTFPSSKHFLIAATRYMKWKAEYFAK